MNGNGKYITISEASGVTGISKVTLYKHLNKGLLPFINSVEGGKEVKKVKTQDVVSVFNVVNKPINKALSEVNKPINDTLLTPLQPLREDIKKIYEEIHSQKIEILQEQSEQLKNQLQPVNQINQLFRAWYEENQELKDQNRELLEQVKWQKKEEEDLKATIEELKKRLDAEEKKPWYKKIL